MTKGALRQDSGDVACIPEAESGFVANVAKTRGFAVTGPQTLVRPMPSRRAMATAWPASVAFCSPASATDKPDGVLYGRRGRLPAASIPLGGW